jgi:long-chain acyl-CoA synthetase
MENNARYVECCAAGERAGLYYTCINSFLTSEEVSYIVNNSESKVLIFSQEKRSVAADALKNCPNVEVAIIVDGPGDRETILNLHDATTGFPSTPIADESLGVAMLYSSGTTGRPKGILRPLPEVPPAQPLPVYEFLSKLWRYRDGIIYLSPAPLYHSAPHIGVNLTIRMGGTAVIMERFDLGDAVAAPGPDRVLDGIQDQLRGHRGRGAPAKDAPGVRVGDERDVDPSRPRRHIGYVGDPQHVRREGAEPAPH